MNLSAVFLIFRKELLEAFRDRKTIVFMILLPILLYPLMGIGFFQIALIQAGKVRARTAKVAYPEVPPPERFLELLKKQGHFVVAHPEDPEEALKQGKIQAVVRFPKGYQKLLAAGGQAQVPVNYDDADELSNSAYQRIQHALDTYGSEILWKRLEDRGLTREFLNPVASQPQQIASPERRAGFHLGKFLPYLILLMIVNGTMYPAIDITAGEKERGTLECLLVSPPGPLEIVLAKFCTVLFFGVLSAVLNLASLGITASSIFDSMQQIANLKEFSLSIPWSTMAITAVLLIPFTVLFAAVLVAIASFAESFKEAQIYITPLFIVVVLPSLVSALPGTELNGFWMVVPVTNLCLLMKALFLQEATLEQVFLVFACSCAYGAAALSLAVRMFSSEEMLYPREHSFALLRSLKVFRRGQAQLGPAQPLGPADALLGYAVVFPLAFYAGNLLATQSPRFSFLLNQWGIILGVPLLLAGLANAGFRETFSIASPKLRSLLGALLMAAGSFLLVNEYSLLQEQWLPVPKEFSESFVKIFKDAAGGSLPLLIFLGALSPAICEEALFRGFILRGLRSRFSKWQCIGLTAALFGFMHMSIHRMVPTTLLGLALAWMVWETGSLLPAILFHFLNNAISLSILHLTDYGSGALARQSNLPAWKEYLLEFQSTPSPRWLPFLGLLLLLLGGWMVKSRKAETQGP